MNHVPEPWTAHKGVLANITRLGEIKKASDIRPFACFEPAIYPADYEVLAEELEEDPIEVAYASAARAAACVNALAGRDPGDFNRLLAAFHDVLDFIDAESDQVGGASIVAPLRAKWPLKP